MDGWLHTTLHMDVITYSCLNHVAGLLITVNRKALSYPALDVSMSVEYHHQIRVTTSSNLHIDRQMVINWLQHEYQVHRH